VAVTDHHYTRVEDDPAVKWTPQPRNHRAALIWMINVARGTTRGHWLHVAKGHDAPWKAPRAVSCHLQPILVMTRYVSAFSHNSHLNCLYLTYKQGQMTEFNCFYDDCYLCIISACQNFISSNTLEIVSVQWYVLTIWLFFVTEM